MAAARGQKSLATLVKSLRSGPISNANAPRLRHLPSLRRTFSLYDQINLIDNVPEDQLRFQTKLKRCIDFSLPLERIISHFCHEGWIGQHISRIYAIGKTQEYPKLPKPVVGDVLEFCYDLGYDDTGFKINNVKYEGSLLIVENKIMSWTPKTFADITAESLSIFKVVHPIPEILILGCGKYVQPVSPELRKFIRSTGMKLEAIDSRNAASTYNILNEEGRPVVAALLPYGVDS